MNHQILTYEQIDKQEWSRLVRESATGTWFQTPEAYDFFASMPELFRPFVVGLENKGRLCGVCSGYVTIEKNPIKQFLTQRAIIIGGPVLADDATNEEVETLMLSLPFREGQGGGFSPIYIETRNFNDYSRWKGAFEKVGFAYQPHLNFHVDCTDKEKMWELLSENRKRQIRKGKWTHGRNNRSNENEIRMDEWTNVSENDIREWYGILAKLYHTKVKTPLFPLSFFLEAYKQSIGKFLLVKYEGKVIGGSMVVELEGKVVYEWFECGLNDECKDQYPSVMATYAGMEYTNAHHIPRYDMMGAGEPNKPYGVRDFKAEFGGELVEYGRFLQVAKPMLYRVGSMGVRCIRRKIR